MRQRAVLALFLCSTISVGVLHGNKEQPKTVNAPDSKKQQPKTFNELVRGKALHLVKEIGTLLKNIEKGDEFIDSLSNKEKEELVVSLERILSRAAREDQLSPSNPINPIPWFDSADVDEIRHCVCVIKDLLGCPGPVDPSTPCNQLKTVFDLLVRICMTSSIVESVVEEIGSDTDAIDSKVDDITATVNETLSKVCDIDSKVDVILEEICVSGQPMLQSVLDDITDNVTVSEQIAGYNLTLCQLLQAILMKVK